MALKLKGQEVTLRFSGPSGPLLSLTKILDLELNTLGEILEEEYLGETEPDFDEIAKGVEVKVTVHHNDPQVFDFFQAVTDRRTRASDASGKFSVIAVMRFPSGATRRGIVADLSFGDIPFKLGSRKAYATTTLSTKAKRVTWM